MKTAVFTIGQMTDQLGQPPSHFSTSLQKLFAKQYKRQTAKVITPTHKQHITKSTCFLNFILSCINHLVFLCYFPFFYFIIQYPTMVFYPFVRFLLTVKYFHNTQIRFPVITIIFCYNPNFHYSTLDFYVSAAQGTNYA